MNKDKRKYHKYLHSPEWKKKRQEAFKIHGKECKNCGATNRLEINHKHYRNIFNEDVEKDLEVLCHWCHAIHHGSKRFLNQRTRGSKKFKRHKRILSFPRAMTMDEYREQEKYGRRPSTMGHAYTKWN